MKNYVTRKKQKQLLDDLKNLIEMTHLNINVYKGYKQMTFKVEKINTKDIEVKITIAHYNFSDEHIGEDRYDDTTVKISDVEKFYSAKQFAYYFADCFSL